MAWMVDEYIKLNNDNMNLGVLTGKPVAWGGSQGRNEATGFGVAVIAREAARELGIDMTKINSCYPRIPETWVDIQLKMFKAKVQKL